MLERLQTPHGSDKRNIIYTKYKEMPQKEKTEKNKLCDNPET